MRMCSNIHCDKIKLAALQMREWSKSIVLLYSGSRCWKVWRLQAGLNKQTYEYVIQTTIGTLARVMSSHWTTASFVLQDLRLMSSVHVCLLPVPTNFLLCSGWVVISCSHVFIFLEFGTIISEMLWRWMKFVFVVHERNKNTLTCFSIKIFSIIISKSSWYSTKYRL